ncbi:MAG: alpha-E domain-containing protein, partial [Planctomycetia bacterium]
ERAENVARFIDVNRNLTLDMPEGSAEQWDALVYTTGDQEKFFAQHDAATRDNVIHFLTFDRENPNSVASCLRAARENARSVRETISTDMWEQLNTFYLAVRDENAPKRATEDPHDFFNEIKQSAHLFAGITDATMTHGEAWHFLRLGRLLERADKTTRLLDVKYYLLLPTYAFTGSPADDFQWSALLRSASALGMYRQKFGRVAPREIIEFLVFDREFPRAVQHCLVNSDESLHAITKTTLNTFCNPAEQRLGQLRAELAYAGVDGVFGGGLHTFLDSLQTRMNAIGSSVHETFFAKRPFSSEP